MRDRGFAYGAGKGAAVGCSAALAPIIAPVLLFTALFLLASAPLWLPFYLLYRWMEKPGKKGPQPGPHFYRQDSDSVPDHEWFNFTNE